MMFRLEQYTIHDIPAGGENRMPLFRGNILAGIWIAENQKKFQIELHVVHGQLGGQVILRTLSEEFRFFPEVYANLGLDTRDLIDISLRIRNLAKKKRAFRVMVKYAIP